MEPNKRFTNKVVIVTGASRGLGRQIATGFAEEGAVVIGCSRSKIETNHPSIDHHIVDISSIESIRLFVDRIVKKHERIDILINNAAIPGDGGINIIDEEQWEDVFNTNVKGPVFLTKMILPYMKSGSSIIFISTRITDKVLPAKLAYSVSKAALVAAAKNIAYEVGELGIRVNAISPTIMPTSFRNNEAYIKDNFNDIIKGTPLRKICTLENVAQSVMFLCSEQAEFITGVVLPVDGGRSL